MCFQYVIYDNQLQSVTYTFNLLVNNNIKRMKQLRNVTLVFYDDNLIFLLTKNFLHKLSDSNWKYFS